jgi:hypothetical protein
MIERALPHDYNTYEVFFVRDFEADAVRLDPNTTKNDEERPPVSG